MIWYVLEFCRWKAAGTLLKHRFIKNIYCTWTQTLHETFLNEMISGSWEEEEKSKMAFLFQCFIAQYWSAIPELGKIGKGESFRKIAEKEKMCFCLHNLQIFLLNALARKLSNAVAWLSYFKQKKTSKSNRQQTQ